MYRLLIFIFKARRSLMLTLALSSLNAYSKQSCLIFLREWADNADRTLLGDSDVNEIATIFKDSHLSDTEAARKVFDIYLKARLRELSPTVQNKVLELLEQRIENRLSPFFGSHYKASNDTVNIDTPSKYRDRIIYFFDLAHELEHVMANHSLFENTGKSATAPWWHPQRSIINYYDELAAMRAEWNFLQSVPEKIRSEMAEEIQNDPLVEPSTKLLWVRGLKNASLDREAYIAAEHAAGRYTRQQLISEDIFVKSMLSLTLIAGGLVLGTLASTEYCIRKLKDPNFKTTTPWFQQICKPNTFVQIELLKLGRL